MTKAEFLSKLPEDLLLEILSLMPTKDAIATTILSKQWRSIWRKLHTLKFNIEDENINTFSLFFNKSLLQVDEKHELKSFSIKIGKTCPCPDDLDIRKCVLKAINRKVRKLKLKLLWSADPILLPKTLYTSKTLVKLSLSDKILLENIPSESSLPCLKTLKLCFVKYKDEDSVANLLSSCPVLDVLIVRRVSDNVKKFKVKVSSLMEFLYHDYMSMEEDEEDRHLVMDTPLLKRFLFASCGRGDFCKIETMMPYLVDLFVDIIGDGFLDEKFIKSMASLITLHMFLTHTMIPCCNTVNFSRLTECKIFPSYSDWLNPLMGLLTNSPKLKKLSIEYETEDGNDFELPISWKQPNSIPKCLTSQLQIFEWRNYGGSEVEKKFITYILGNSKCLKMVKISILSTFNFGEKQMIMEDLKHISRVSKSFLFFI